MSAAKRGEGAALRSRGAELRMAAALPGAELRPILDAALAEVDAAADALTGRSDRGPSGAVHAERRLLHAVFLQLPVPVFLLGQDATIRRTNTAAAELLGSAPGYATGKQFAALADVPDRARVQTQIATTLRTGKPRRLRCRLLSADGPVDAGLTLCAAGLRGDADQLIVAVTGNSSVTTDKTGGPAAARRGDQADMDLVRQLTRRLDLAAGISRRLLEDITVSESAMVQRCARTLAAELGGWVIVDIERRGRLRRQFVTGPDDPEAEELARTVAQADPVPGSAPWVVHESASGQLLTHAEDADALGPGPDGLPLVMQLQATSVLSVPLADGERSYGALTLARQASHGHFGLSEVAVTESIGEQLGLAIRAGRTFRRHSAVAQALQASLLPGELAAVPGAEIATAHVGAEGPDVGGDFYDVYVTPDGTGVLIGDVCGTARDTGAVASAARQAVRVIGRSEPDPAMILRAANDVLVGENLAGQFVTAHAGRLRWSSERLSVSLGSAGQPGPALITKDGQVRQLRGGGQPLGIFPDAEPSAQELELAPGDVLFFYTDGVADARHAEHGYFGDVLTDELAALAGKSAAEIVAGMRRRVLEFCGGEVRDDMTMLALRVTEPPDF